MKRPTALALGAWAVVLVGAHALVAWAMVALPADVARTSAYPWMHLGLFALYAGALVHVWRRPSGAAQLGIVVVAALVMRLCALSPPPELSSDVYRYAWDGRVQRAGFSPYAHPPAAPALASLRDTAIHSHINRPEAVTIYPPGAQALFRLLPYDVTAVRAIMVGFDLLAIAGLVLLLRRRGWPAQRVAAYAWNPLVVWEVAGNGHLDAAVVAAVVWAVVAADAARWRAAGAALGAAAALKLYPAFALVALPRRAQGWAAGVLGAAYLAYLPGAGLRVLGFLPHYASAAEDHNIGVRALIEAVAAPLAGARTARVLAFAACFAALAAVAVAIARRRRRWSTAQGVEAAAAGWTLLVPTALHPWYALWLMPWAALRPRLGWLWLAAVLPLSYLKYAAPRGVMPAWVRPVEFVPVAAWLLDGLWRDARRGAGAVAATRGGWA